MSQIHEAEELYSGISWLGPLGPEQSACSDVSGILYLLVNQASVSADPWSYCRFISWESQPSTFSPSPVLAQTSSRKHELCTLHSSSASETYLVNVLMFLTPIKALLIKTATASSNQITRLSSKYAEKPTSHRTQELSKMLAGQR